MKKYIVLDTNILIDHSYGHAQWLDEYLLSTTHILIIPTIVIAEYLATQEFDTPQGQQKADRYLSLFKIQLLTTEIARIIAQLVRHKTYPVSATTGDIIIAATALSFSAELATRNQKDFAKIPDLIFFKPPQD